VVELYTLPLAVGLLGVGVLRERQRLAAALPPEPSWTTIGPGLLVGVVPTLLVALGDQNPLRPLIALAIGAALLLAGVVGRRKAPVDIGLVLVAILGLRQLAPLVGDLPRWATLGVCGTVLLVVGATFEQRRRDVAGVRGRYSGLR
jgi:hypothetical protein